jgi:methyltransferase (TIGR00027 family)
MTTSASWDAVSGVGLTALGAAAIRAVESARPHPLVRDPYAAAFVRAAGPLPVQMPTGPAEADGGPLPVISLLGPYFGTRTRFFDEFLTAATGDGIRQAVILAAGLDTRAFRLDWPDGTTIYELDAPGVIDFKDRVLASESAQPRCIRRTVPADLREDWQAALLRGGFDPARPTVWLAEGLLPYLADEAKVRLVTAVGELSAAGSRAGVEHLGRPRTSLLDHLPEAPANRDFDYSALLPEGQQLDAADLLTEDGWSVTAATVAEVAERFGRPLPSSFPATIGAARLITGHRAAAGAT